MAVGREGGRLSRCFGCEQNSAHLMAGQADYLLKVVVSDTDHFARIHRQHLARLPGVAQIHSSMGLRTVCKATALPV